MEIKKEIEEKIYNNNKILEWYIRKMESTKTYIAGGKFKDGKPYNGRPFRPFELRNLNKLLDDYKEGKERVVKFIEKLEKNLKEVNK